MADNVIQGWIIAWNLLKPCRVAAGNIIDRLSARQGSEDVEKYAPKRLPCVTMSALLIK